MLFAHTQSQYGKTGLKSSVECRSKKQGSNQVWSVVAKTGLKSSVECRSKGLKSSVECRSKKQGSNQVWSVVAKNRAQIKCGES
ncbi:hypothetical protein DPMN_170654 [Dreissena polymorpha]|uniref:Uncharacterized protein n=1 Tax=Dreissena polymorpha TaxID=45954 RepID=A0A9D4IEG2_DREPO|nr:hypothetical protein DPMN_170654 [Dreissena polymorpha]